MSVPRDSIQLMYTAFCHNVNTFYLHRKPSPPEHPVSPAGLDFRAGQFGTKSTLKPLVTTIYGQKDPHTPQSPQNLPHQFRSLMLYPVELRGRAVKVYRNTEISATRQRLRGADTLVRSFHATSSAASPSNFQTPSNATKYVSISTSGNSARITSAARCSSSL